MNLYKQIVPCDGYQLNDSSVHLSALLFYSFINATFCAEHSPIPRDRTCQSNVHLHKASQTPGFHRQ